MLKKLFPTVCYSSVYTMDFKSLYECGYRGVIFDIDNTLVEHDAPADEKAVALINSLRELGFKVCFISNNKGPRVEEFNKKINAYFVCDAKKPSSFGYLKAVEVMGVDKENLLAIGDQIFTDILGANRAGIESVLLKRISAHETVLIHLKRILEAPVLALYKCHAGRKKPTLSKLEKQA